MPQTPGGTAISVRHAYAVAASLASFHSLRVGNAGGRLVWNVRTWPAMAREKAQAAPTARPKVLMLAEALNTDISWIRQHTEFGEQARRWAQAKGPAGLLLRSPVLEQAEWSCAS
jgi:hypothetical protein